MPGGKEGGYKHRSVDASRFAMVPRSDIPRSAFDVPTSHRTTFSAGVLVPLYLDEILPGDSVRLKMTAFARLATPIVPVMDNIILESFFFFVPNRLVWTNWERFMGEQVNPTDTTAFVIPQIGIDGNPVGSLQDYFGITVNGTAETTLNVNALPFRGYQLIWNEFFRHQDLQVPAVVDVDDGPDSITDYECRIRGKRHDYFTSAMPWPQKPTNSTAVSGMEPFYPGGNMSFQVQTYGIGAPVSGLGPASPPGAGVAGVAQAWSGGRTVTPLFQGVDPLLYRTGSAGVPDIRVLVNDIRTAVMIQGMLERNARGGTRYAELVRSHFGVTSPDARLQRPEYLGGGRAHVTVNPVAQTSASGATGTTTVLGELAGVGTAVASDHGFSQSFTEHGYIFGLVSVRADLSYQNGTNRMWFRRTQYDFYWLGLAHLGEQAILSKELYSVGDFDTAGDNSVFGYQERWSEYKYKPSRVSGAFRSTHTTPLDMWHLAQDFFPVRPVLNEAFVFENPPMDRVLQVATTFGEAFLIDSYFDVRMVRCMPMFSIPGLGPRL